MTIISVYEKEYKILKDLPSNVKLAIKELIFSYRDGKETICAVFNNKNAVLNLLGTLPDRILNINVDTYGVDLESIGTDKLRIYHSSTDKDKTLIGYYVRNNSIFEYKIYKRTNDRAVLLIDRYNADDELISKDEKEIRAERSDWKGSKKIFDLADANGFYTNLLMKSNKDQCYVRIRVL